MSDKYSPFLRQKAIKALVEMRDISDQNQLVALLKTEYEIEANQAVGSRDLHKLDIVKKMSKGVLVYKMPEVDVATEILRLALVDINHNESMIIINTHPGLAAFVGDCLDQYQELEIFGCLAGENVVFVAPKSIQNIHTIYEAVCKKLHFQKKQDL